MELRNEVVKLPYGEVSVAIGKCDYCGHEWLISSPKWIQVDVHEFQVRQLMFDTYMCASWYFHDKSLKSNEVIPDMGATNARQ